MKPEEIHKIVSAQHIYFSSGATLPVSIRLDALHRLKAAILRHESDISQAISVKSAWFSMNYPLCSVIQVATPKNNASARHWRNAHRAATPSLLHLALYLS